MVRTHISQPPNVIPINSAVFAHHTRKRYVAMGHIPCTACRQCGLKSWAWNIWTWNWSECKPGRYCYSATRDTITINKYVQNVGDCIAV